MSEVKRTRALADGVLVHCDSEESLTGDPDRTKRGMHIGNSSRLEICSSDNSENCRNSNSHVFSDTLNPKYCSVSESHFTELFDVTVKEENCYKTDLITLKENRNLRRASPKNAGKLSINRASKPQSTSNVKSSCNPTFLIVDRVPQLHYEMPSGSNQGALQNGQASAALNLWPARSKRSQSYGSSISSSASEGLLASPRNRDMVRTLRKPISLSSCDAIVKDPSNSKDSPFDQLSTNLFTTCQATSTQVGTSVGSVFPINVTPAVSNILGDNFNNNQLTAVQPRHMNSGARLSHQNKKWNTSCSPVSTTAASTSTKHYSLNPAMTVTNNAIAHAGSHSPVLSGRIPRPMGSSSSIGAGSATGHMQMPIVPGSRGVTGAKGPKVLMMVYGNAEECARVGGCGPRWVYRSEVPEEKPGIGVMDKDGTLDISFDEWRDYLLFHPSANLHDIIHYWRHATSLDIGEDLSIPDDFSPEEWLSGKWWRHLVAGGVAGMVSRTCTAPLDRLKVFLQVHGSHKFKSLYSCLRYMIDEGGVKSLWRGNGVNVVKIAPESALKFAAYEQAKSFIMTNFGDPNRELRIMERFAAGSFAGGFSQSVIYPMEVLKTRLALRKSGQYRGIVDAAKQIYRTEGLRSFYRGYVPNLLGIIPYAGIDLAVYETLKHRYALMSPGQNDPSVFVIIGCGALSSSCGQIASYPLALIRTRLQAQVLSKDFVHSPDRPTTPIGIFKHILKTEGPLGLYRGIAPNFMKVAPAVSISYVMYEKCREALGIRMT